MGGAQGNDDDLSVIVSFFDGSTLSTTGALNWVKNASENTISYFGVIFETQPDDGYVPPTAGYKHTYIFPIPGYETTFASLVAIDNVTGSANFDIGELNSVLETNYGNTAELSLVKTGTLNDDDGTAGVSAGDTISYAFTVENTGGLTVTNITLTDNLAGIVLNGGPIASLAPGDRASSIFTGTYTITETDIANGGVRNAATVSGDSDGNGTNDVSDSSGTYSYLDQATDVVFNQTAALALVKTATLNDTDGSGNHSAGDTITYNFAVHNTGDQTVTGITITDPLVTVSGGPIDLAAGALDDTTFTGTYTVTQSDVNTGSVTNSAYVSGTDSNGWTVSDTSGTEKENDTSTVVTLTASPSIALVKGGVLDDGGDGADAGDTISYNFTIKNTGNVTLSNIRISDTMLEGTGGTLIGGPISLAPGATSSHSFTGSYTLTSDDISAGPVSNTATVTGSSPGNTDDVSDVSGTSESNNDYTIVSPNISPSIEGWKLSTITDADNSGGLSAGDTIVYTISAKNTGNVVLTNVGVQSDTLQQGDGTSAANSLSSTDFDLVLGTSTTLKPGEIAQFRGSYTVAQADIDAGGLSNTATVSGVYNSTNYTDVTHDAADTDGTATNASDPTENFVANIAPTLTGPNSSTGATSAISVNENQTAVFSFSANEAVTWTISGDDAAKFSIDSATGVLTFNSAPDYEYPNDVGATSGNNTYVVMVTCEDVGGLAASQTVTVTVLDLKGSLGGIVTYSNGNVAAGVTVNLWDSNNSQVDTTITDSSGWYTFNNLAIDTYVVEFLHNTRSAKGRSARGQNNGRYVQSIELIEQDFNDVDGILIDPSGVVYNALTRSPVADAVVRLYVTRDDNGSRVQVQDTWLETSGTGGLSGQSTGANGQYTFILNGSAPSGIYDIEITPPPTFIFASLEIPATAGPYVPGDGAGIESIQNQPTAPTDDQTTYYLEFDFAITSDANTTSNGVINNHIPIDPIQPPDSAALTVTKMADTTDFSSPVTSGDTISYTITAENTGNVALDNVRISDALTPTGGSANSLTPIYISGDTDADSVVDVGEIWTWKVSYDLTQADIDSGGLSNLATVTVDDPDDTEITVESSASGNSTTGLGNGTATTTTLSPALGLTVTKTADKTTISSPSAGDTIRYTITVKNTGNVRFSNLSLTDALTSDEAWSASDGGDADGTGTLDVGETWTFAASYAIKSADITAGSVENVAYATGETASGSSLTVYSGAQGEASTATSDPSGGGGVITALTASSLVSEIEDDLIHILRDDLAMTMTQQSKQIAGYSTAALDRLKLQKRNDCADLVNEKLAREPVLFLNASATITPSSTAILDNLSELLAQCPDETFDIEGHTDSNGSDDYNLQLSYARSAAVVSALVSRGLKRERFVALGYGETRPVAENSTEEGRRLNRRVVFIPAMPTSRNVDCGAAVNYERRFYAKVDDTGANVDGLVSSDIDSCGNGEREFYEIRGSYLVQGAYTRHGMVTFNYLKEHTSASDRLWGQFLGVYASTNTVVDEGTGKIDGYGLSAGLYGAQRIDAKLYLDYYLGAASGRHDFELNFSPASGNIDSNGYYTYLAAFAGVALSGETQIGDQRLEPRAGVQIAYSPGGQAQVNASREALQDSGTIDTGAVNGGRAFGELRFVDLLPSNKTQISVAPRGFCEIQIGTALKQCGAGISFEFSRHIEEGTFFDFSVDGDVTRKNRSYSLTFEYGLNLELGRLIGGTSFDANGASEIAIAYQLDY